MRWNSLLSAMVVIATLGLSATSGAATPPMINFQGLLLDSAGAPVADGSHSTTFTLYNRPVGGTVLWTETQSVTTSAGLFSTLLGVTTPISVFVFGDTACWLGVSVAPDPELSPRQKLVSVGYSQRVASVDGAEGGTINGKVSIGPGHTNTGAYAFVAGASNTAIGDTSVIAGGHMNTTLGTNSSILGGYSNEASAWLSTVGGGYDNTAGNVGSTVTGGSYNRAAGVNSFVGGGVYDTAAGDQSTVAGGMRNRATAQGGAVVGGNENLAGGTFNTFVGGGFQNRTLGSETAVLGGQGNVASGDQASVSGGVLNVAAGYNSNVGGGRIDTALGAYSAVSGGFHNVASADFALISGGATNLASGEFSSVGGGESNRAVHSHATVGGGLQNNASDSFTVVHGGSNGSATARYSAVSGGSSNWASGDYSAVGGGSVNRAAAQYSFVGGGVLNRAGGSQSFVGGGDGNTASGIWSTVGGGQNDTAVLGHAVVAGGQHNVAASTWSAVVGGQNNRASGSASFVGAGANNLASGAASTVAGGGGAGADSNIASGNFSTIGGGSGHRVSGDYATVPGGRANSATARYAHAAGRRAKANHIGAFVWADSTDADFASTAAGQFLVRSSTVGLGTNTPVNKLDVEGSAVIGATYSGTNSAPANGLLVEGLVGIGTTSPTVALHVVRTGTTPAQFDRTTNDGTIINLAQDGVVEGTISVTGTTVSYNAFTGSHYGLTSERIEHGHLVTLTGENTNLYDRPVSEVIYGIRTTTRPNDPACLGSYLGLLESGQPAGAGNPHLVMAVGNGVMWVTETDGGIEPGDYLIASDVPGHAMKDDAERFEVGHIVARAAERVNWSTVTEEVNGRKHKLISVLFGNFVRSNSTRLEETIRHLEERLQNLEAGSARAELR